MSDITTVDALPSLEKTQVDLLRVCARAQAPLSDKELAKLSEMLLGAPLTVTPGRWGFCPPGLLEQSVNEPLVAAVVRVPGGGPTARVIVELDASLANCVVDRALGGRADDVPPIAVEPLSEAAKGVIAYVLAQLLSESETPEWRLATLVTTKDALHAVLGEAGQVVWPLEVRLADRKGFVRVWIPTDTAESLPPKRALNDAIGKAETTLRVIAGRASLSARELATVEPGDAITLDEAWNAPGEPTTRLLVQLTTSPRLSVWCRATGAGLVVDEVDRSLDRDATHGGPMSKATTEDVIDNVGDLPIQLTVEVARFHIPVSELAALSPGEVLLSGRQPSEEVTLRAGDRAVATGQLVNVEGELAVRVIRIGI